MATNVEIQSEYQEAKRRIAKLDRCIRILERTIEMYEGKKHEIESILIIRQDTRNTRRKKVLEMYQDAMDEKEDDFKKKKLTELVDFLINELKMNKLI